MMGPRQPPIAPKVAFPMPTTIRGGDHDFTKYIVENHHLSMYKSVLQASAQIDNAPPKSWVLRKGWEASGGRKSAGDAVWDLNTTYMEKLLADEITGANQTFKDSSWAYNILKQLRAAMKAQDVPLIAAVKAFQASDPNGLSRAEFSSLLAHYKIHVSGKQLGDVFTQVAGNDAVASFVDIETAFVKAEDVGRIMSAADGVDEGGNLIKVLGERVSRVREVFDMFDPDGHGTITVHEFARGLKALHIHATEREVQQLMRDFDKDSTGMLDYVEFTDFLLGKKRQRDKKRMDELETRLLTFCQEGSTCGLKVTPRHWKRLLSDEVQKRLTDNIDLIERTLHDKDPRFGSEDEGFVTPVQLHRVLLEKLGLKVSTDHFTYFIQKLPRRTIGGQSVVAYQPFVDYFRGVIVKEKKRKVKQAAVSDQRRRAVENQVRTGPPPTRHDAVASAVLEAVKNADWGSRLAADIRRAKNRARTYFLEDPAMTRLIAKERPKFDAWLKSGPKKHHGKAMARRQMQMVQLLKSQSDQTGIDAIMMAFKATDRDKDGNIGVSGCLSAQKFKEVIRDVTGTRMQGWNDFEGVYNMSPRQLEYCVDIADKVPARVPIWQWKDNQGTWCDYDEESSESITSKKEFFKEKDDTERKFKLKLRGREYEVNLDKMEQMRLLPEDQKGRKREIRCAGRPNENAGMIKYKNFVRRLIKAEAKQRYEAYGRQGGAQRRPELGELETETRKLLGGVTYEMQMALHQTLATSNIKAVFEKWDKDGDGNISATEMRAGLKSLGITIQGKEISDAQIEKLIEVLDQDDDGELSYEEFAKQFANPPKQSAREVLGESLSPKIREQIRKNKTNLKKIFIAFDADGDGSISAPELRLGMKHLGIDLSSKEIAELIKVMDANGDGSIDWNEFQAVFGDTGESKKGMSRSYQRVLESRNRIAEQHPEIMGMRNKALASQKNKAGATKGADAATHIKIRETVRKLLRGHRVHLVDAFRVFDANNSKVLTLQNFEKMLQFFDVTGTKISMAEIRSLFQRLSLDSQGKGALVGLDQVREFFGRDV